MGPYIDEELMSFQSGGAELLYGRLATAYTRCPLLHVDNDDGSSASITSRRTPFPAFGDAFSVFRQDGVIDGVTIQGYVVLCSVGDVLLAMDIGAIGPLSKDAAEAITRSAVTKVTRLADG